MERPKVGVGVIIENKEGQILVGKRKGSHSPLYSIPGGHLELGETFEEAATKEIFEETGLQIFSPSVIAITNNLRTYRNEKVHYVSIILYANQFQGTPTIMEKDKCELWIWVEPLKVPKPHFDASEFAVECFLKKRFYIPNQQ
ncbi:nucleotide triphosphate diphosphatase NUDT15 [Perlabentimonas gracilis]|uniref:nucleotide triphosphate diphosphatase NUDT15 n=1 Tax=Perlabentimonas gracilis TaxID=2715279 RepID=UPI00140DDBFF|nr:NUDIX domain-containing protein [Perlabentimonas gracilis]NHB68023.1 NUDIX domain-containing protein [Perlabentimonas gracilis]